MTYGVTLWAKGNTVLFVDKPGVCQAMSLDKPKGYLTNRSSRVLSQATSLDSQATSLDNEWEGEGTRNFL
jgi:hypothetical protein